MKQTWKKLGPVFPVDDPGDAWDSEPTCPYIMRLGDELRMYYHGRIRRILDDGRHHVVDRIGCASGNVADPMSWQKWPGNPLLGLGEVGAPDSHTLGYPCVVPINETHWHMYYVGWGGEFWDHVPREQLKKWRLLTAESDDGGRTWSKTGREALATGEPYACDEHGAGSCCVLPVGGEHWMWYTAVRWPVADWYQISVSLAVSTDGGHAFERHPAAPVMALPPRKPDRTERIGSICSKPCVVFADGLFRMWFTCADDLPYRIHYAESRDGIHFHRHPEAVLDVSARGWDDTMVCYPNILRLPGRTLMFYCGNRNHGIGVADLGDAVEGT